MEPMKQHPYLTIAVLAWVVSLPWAALRGPLELAMVLGQAIGAGLFPAVAGWLTLLVWRKHDDRLKTAIQAALVVAGVVLFTSAWSWLGVPEALDRI